MLHRALVALLLVSCSPSGPGSECDRLRPLNDAVRQGRLSEAQRVCLAARVADESDPARHAASRVLLHDARAADDGGAAWSALAREHVRSFPDDLVTLVHLANHQQRQGPSGATQSLAHAEQGLDWIEAHPATGASEVRAHHDLLKARAVAVEMLAPPEAPAENRERTARAARDWYVKAVALELPTERALAMCMNGGAVAEFCRGETPEFLGPSGAAP